MRKLLLFGAAGLLLAGCARPSQYPSDEVLRRSAAVSQTLSSSTFEGEGSVHLQSPTAQQTYNFSMEGTLQNAGHQTQLKVAVLGNIQGSEQQYNVSGDLEMISLSRSEVYLKVQNVKSTPEFPLLSSDLLRNFVNQWWLLTGTGTTAEDQEPLSPDPSLLRLQSEVVKVTKDHGIQRREGHDVYVYDVTVGQPQFDQFLQRLAPAGQTESGQLLHVLSQYNATGTLEIDAENFYVRRVTWNLTPKPGSDQPMSVEFTVQFQNQNNAPRIQAPAGAKPFRSPLMIGVEASSSSTSHPRSSSSQR